MRWFKVIGGLTALMLLMAGCIRFEGNITINDDGSGEVRLLRALNLDAFGEEAALFGTDEFCSEFSAENEDLSVFPAGAVANDYSEDGFCGTEVTYSLAASTDHSASIQGVFEDGGARLFQQGENWIFESNLDTSELTNDSEGLISDDEFNELLGDASLKFIIDLPGRAIDGQNNATKVGADGVFEWDIDLLNPPPRLFAQTEPGSGGGDGGGGIGLILIIVAVVLLAAAAAWWFLTQRNKGDSGGTPPLGAVGSTPPAASPPVAAPGAAAPPAASPVKPANPSAQQTVAMSAADAQAAVGGAAPSSDPVWDETLNAWVINDPNQGKLVHDPATDSWKPA